MVRFLCFVSYTSWRVCCLTHEWDVRAGLGLFWAHLSNVRPWRVIWWRVICVPKVGRCALMGNLFEDLRRVSLLVTSRKG